MPESARQRRRSVSVIGGRAGNSGPLAVALAYAVGAELGRRGYGLITGGDDGVAAAAGRGCAGAGGETIALLKWNRVDDCGPEVTWSIPTSMDVARSNILNWACDGIIAFEGRYGTMAEIAMALDTARPLIVLGRNELINPAAFAEASCRVIEDPDPARAAEIIDLLESLIAELTLPPVRPDAALAGLTGVGAGAIALRGVGAGDLPMFTAAFSDPQVRQWWDLDPTAAALRRFQHARCLVVTEHSRPVGFLEYHAEPDPDFDHIGLDIVVANAADRDRGIGSAALTCFARAVFEAGHHRITVVPSPDNHRAIRCYGKVGFRRVGTMRNYERYRGQWRDAELFDLLPDDLAAKGPA